MEYIYTIKNKYMTQESITEHLLSDVRECAEFFECPFFFSGHDRSSLSAPVFSDESASCFFLRYPSRAGTCRHNSDGPSKFSNAVLIFVNNQEQMNF